MNHNDTKPVWNGETVNIGSLTDYFYPVIMLGETGELPFSILLHGTEDKFIPLFASREHLERNMVTWKEQIGDGDWYEKTEVRQVTSDEHAASLPSTVDKFQVLALGEVTGTTHLMIDPEIISRNHTRWAARVKRGDLWKYVRAELN